MPTGRITIYNNGGVPLTDIRASVIRSWVLNGIGQAEFEIAYTDTKCRRAYLEFGNLIKIEHTHLPDWVGVIDTPRQWREGKVLIRAYEMGKLLMWRISPASLKITGTAGDLVTQLLQIANEQGDTTLRIGDVYGGGGNREETLGDTIFTHLDGIQKRTGFEWTITPDSDGGSLTCNLNWHYKTGINVPSPELTEKNTEKNSYTFSEEGDIVNDLTGYGDALTPTTRLTAFAADQTSIGQYGRRQAKKVYYGNRVQSTLDANVEADLVQKKDPIKVFQATVLNVNSVFNTLRLGNRINTNILGFGFTDDGKGYQSQVRILGMRYSDFSDKVELLTTEDTEDG